LYRTVDDRAREAPGLVVKALENYPIMSKGMINVVASAGGTMYTGDALERLMRERTVVGFVARGDDSTQMRYYLRENKKQLTRAPSFLIDKPIEHYLSLFQDEENALGMARIVRALSRFPILNGSLLVMAINNTSMRWIKPDLERLIERGVVLVDTPPFMRSNGQRYHLAMYDERLRFALEKLEAERLKNQVNVLLDKVERKEDIALGIV